MFGIVQAFTQLCAARPKPQCQMTARENGEPLEWVYPAGDQTPGMPTKPGKALMRSIQRLTLV